VASHDVAKLQFRP